jgi:uncharacterized caspase-like protein
MKKGISDGRRFMRAAVVLLILAVACFSGPARADASRVALVIGIGAYQNVPGLPNPPRDARSVAASLRNLGFDVEEKIDSNYADFKEAVRLFGKRAEKADVAVVFYAGHGMQVEHENFLIPADAQFERERDLLYEAIKLDIVLDEVARAKKIGLVILDACRNNPFYDKVARSVASRGLSTSKGLAKVDNVPPNTAVAMATRGDAIAEDGSGEHSPYTAAILAHLEVPGLELGLFFRSVRDAVLKATDNRQEPYFASSLGADPFYFYAPQRVSTENRMDAIKKATEGNPEYQALLAEFKRMLDERLPPPGPTGRVIEINKPSASQRVDPPETQKAAAPPQAIEPLPPPPKLEPPPSNVAVVPPPPAAKEVRPNVTHSQADDRRKPPRDFLCTSITERAQVGEQLTDAERVYLQKCSK